MDPFRCLLRVRYAEIDGQKIVFNARWADYVDLSVSEFFYAVFEGTNGAEELETHLVKQTIQWKGPAYFDDVLVATVRLVHLGTTSFTVHTEFRRDGEDMLLVEAETVYVSVDPTTHRKRPLNERERTLLPANAEGKTADLAGSRRTPRSLLGNR